MNLLKNNGVELNVKAKGGESGGSEVSLSPKGGQNNPGVDSKGGSIIPYEIEVKTSSEFGSGSDAKVTISIFGTMGELLNVPLVNSNKKDPFESDSFDIFSFKEKDIGKVSKINIGHDGMGMSAAWKLSTVKIIVNKEKAYNFSAHRWLDSDKGDKKTRIDLFPDEKVESNKEEPKKEEPKKEEPKREEPKKENIANPFISLNANLPTVSVSSSHTYDIEVKTASEFGSATISKVTISLFGTKGELLNLSLSTNTNNKKPFENNSLDNFTFKENKDIGKITKINIGHDGIGSLPGTGWKLEFVKVIVNKNAVYLFNANRWLDSERGDKKTRIDLFPNEPANEQPAAINFGIPGAQKLANTVENKVNTTANNAISLAATTIDPNLERITRKFNQLARDGSIKLEDGIHLIRSMGENPSKKEYKSACEELKMHNKEKLDLKESILLIEKMIKNEPKSELEKSLMKAFKRYDKNNDGYLDLKDFEEKMTKTGEKLSAEEFKDMIRLADIDHDGRISYQEFVRIFTQ